MKSFNTNIAQNLASTATGLLAGAFLYGTLNLVPAFFEVPLNVHLAFRIQLMAHNSTVMQALMGTSIVATLWSALTVPQRRSAKVLLLLASACALTSLLVTRFGNVPINQQMRGWSPARPPVNYMALLQQWNVFNTIRTVTALACFLMTTVVTRLR